jgi:hypothetical protein
VNAVDVTALNVEQRPRPGRGRPGQSPGGGARTAALRTRRTWIERVSCALDAAEPRALRRVAWQLHELGFAGEASLLDNYSLLLETGASRRRVGVELLRLLRASPSFRSPRRPATGAPQAQRRRLDVPRAEHSSGVTSHPCVAVGEASRAI